MKWFWWVVVGTTVFLIILVAVGVTLRARNQSSTPASSDDTIETKLKGVTFSPKSYQGQNLLDFFELVSEMGGIVSWHGPWDDLSTATGGGHLVATNTEDYNYTPIAIVHNSKGDNTGLAKPFDEATKADYTKRAVDFVTKFRPHYFGIGVEINRMATKAPRDFESYVDFYPEVVAAIKQASPGTQIVTTFELNTMKGLSGGLFGGTNDPSKNQWSLLEKFDAADIFAFSVYPGLIYKSPAEIPDNYLTEIATKTYKPIAFTEIGWHAAASPKGWESSESEQAEFVDRFFQLAKDTNYIFAIWTFLFDQQTIEPFGSAGLIKADGTKRPAWEAWTKSR